MAWLRTQIFVYPIGLAGLHAIIFLAPCVCYNISVFGSQATLIALPIPERSLIIFLDTEFTSFEEPYLISIGLIADENELYFELAGISHEICAPFVQANVLPLLTGPVLKPIEGAEQLAAFLSLCGPEVTFFCDAPRYDITLLTPFLPSGLRWNYAVPSFQDAACEGLFERTRKNAFANGLRRHHALDDAKAIAAAWAATRRI
jgi:hypothetical protein